jgi:transglutaminase-like putative cysteine protease
MNTTVAERSRLEEAHVAATICLVVLTTVTTMALCRVFADWGFLRPMLAVALGTHAIAFALRAARAPLWLTIPVLLVSILVVLGLVFYRDTLSVMLPTGRTLDIMRVDLRLVFRQFPTTVAPVPSQGPFATAAAAALAVVVILSDTFAFRAFGRVEAVVPSGVLFVFTSALGINQHRVIMAALWIAAALLTIAVLRFDHDDQETSWMGARRLTLMAALPAIAITIGVSAVGAIAIAPKLPGAGAKALVDTRGKHSSVTEVLSPLVDIRARMKNRGNSELFTVSSTDGGHYWRVVGLPNFDGSKWSPPQETLTKVDSQSDDVSSGSTSQQTFTIENLGGPLVPAAYRPIRVDPPDKVFYAADAQTLVLGKPNVLQSGDQIQVTSVISQPSPDQLRSASTDGAPAIYYALPSNLPQTAATEAARVTAGLSTSYDKALALQNYFWTNFQYDLDVQLGESSDAIEAFLRGRKGFCQQFAGTFAVMARTLGIPARVAVGYTQGDLQSDGLFHVFGRHAHAWPEVWFQGVGWVPFEPTPGRGNPDAQGVTGHAPAQDDSGGTPGAATGPTLTAPPVSSIRPGDPDASTTVPGGTRPGGDSTTTTTEAPAKAVGTGPNGSFVPVVVFGLILLVALWVLLAPRVLGALHARRGRTARDRTVAAWYRACHLLGMAGAPEVGGSTPLEYADIAVASTGVDQGILRELAVQVTRAVYAPGNVDDSVADQCDRLVAEIDAMCKPRIPLGVRLQALVDPRMIFRRIAG